MTKKRVRQPGYFECLRATITARELLESLVGALFAAAATSGVLYMYVRWVAQSI